MRGSRIKVVHLSSAHGADDSRIFWKECLSLAQAGYDVCFVVPGDRPCRRENVEIVTVRRRSGRLARMLLSTAAVVGAGLRCRGDVYHFHDPELIPWGLALRLLGKRVVYDAHEDVPRDLLFKRWVPLVLRWPLSRLIAGVEWIADRTLSGIVAATPTIARRFPASGAALVQNYARLAEFPALDASKRPHGRTVAYVGGVTPERGAVEMVDAMARVERYPDARLVVAGEIWPDWLVGKLAGSAGWRRVDYRGRQDRAGVHAILAQADVGLALFHPVQSYVESQPIKLFEYMAAGLPVIAADFPGFRKIVEANGCGLCVPPLDTAAIAAAIEWVFEHPGLAQEMGRRGRELVQRTYNWEREAESLLRLYDRVLADAPARRLVTGGDTGVR